MPEDDADITPLIDTKAADYVEGLIKDAQDKGAKEVISFKREGNLISPVLFDNVTTDMRLAWKNHLAQSFQLSVLISVEEAVEISNKSEYGLQAAVFTNNFPLAFKIAEQLEVVLFTSTTKHNVVQITSHSLVLRNLVLEHKV